MTNDQYRTVRTRGSWLLTAILLVALTAGSALAQDERVIAVAPTSFGALNDAIAGDTTDTGERVDPNTIYELERDGRYLLNGRIRHSGYHLTIRAAEGDGAIPVIQPGTREDGTADNPSFAFDGDFTLQNLYLLNQSDAGGKNSHSIAVGSPVHGELDGVVMEVGRWLGIRLNVDGASVTVRNSTIRNLTRPADPGNGKFLDPRGNNPGAIIFENNTFYNLTSELIRESGGLVQSLVMNHNTIYNVGAMTRNDARVNSTRVVKGTFTNNLIINMAPLGDVTTDWDYFGGVVEGREDVGAIFALDSLRAGENVPEDVRLVTIANNNINWAPELLAHFETQDTVQVYSILTPLAESFQAAGLVVYENNIDEQLAFTNAPPVQKAIDYNIGWYTTNCDDDPPLEGCDFVTNPAEWDPTVSIAASPWPLPEDFTYPTTSASYTAAAGGYPLGDLNWFPEQKAAWEAGGGDAVAIEGQQEVIDGFVIRGNYPNPFNPVTNILFDLDKPADISVEVFDMLGRNVLSVPATARAAGSGQTMAINATTLASGVYFYRMDVVTTGKQLLSRVGQMTLVK